MNMRTLIAIAGWAVPRALCVLGLAAAGPLWAQQAGKVASQKEQAELALPPGTPSVQPRGPQRPAAKDSDLRYGPSLYDPAHQTQRDAARADETDEAPPTDEVENKQGAGQAVQRPAAPEAARPGTRKPDQKRPVARRRSTTQDIATMPPPPPLPPAARIAPLPPLPPAAVPAGSMPATCGPAGCLTPSGQHLNPGVGTALITPDGRTCVRTGATVQCN